MISIKGAMQMKSSGKILIGALAIAMIGLSACSKKKSGDSGGTAAAPPAPATTTATGVPGTGGSGQIKVGTWQGSIGIVNMDVYRQMMFELQRCSNVDNNQNQNQNSWNWSWRWNCGHNYLTNCSSLSGYTYVTINVQGGFVPGPGRFSLTPASYGSWMATMAKQGDAYMNSDNNGFQVHSYVYQYYGQQNQAGQIKVVSYYTDSTQMVLNTQVFYKDQKVAEGQTRMQNQYYYQQNQGY